ncbi:DUF84 family protein [Pseudalkalibacillus sp. SCS-8]|uniref:DUF84 family protein n=1 Tax=Pseudalkalibacillus nanhaiensis TaxID=3115291 RepID=UPI0032DA31D4
MKIAVGSKNPAKVQAVHTIVESLGWKVDGIDVPSNVSEQPFSVVETRQGAKNRARACVEKGYEVGIGLEGGVEESPEGLFLCNWGALVTETGQVYYASGAGILLPERISKEVRDGIELGDVMASFTDQTDIRKKDGAVGIFTAGYVTRSEMFSHIVKLLIGQYQYTSHKE